MRKTERRVIVAVGLSVIRAPRVVRFFPLHSRFATVWSVGSCNGPKKQCQCHTLDARRVDGRREQSGDWVSVVAFLCSTCVFFNLLLCAQPHNQRADYYQSDTIEKANTRHGYSYYFFPLYRRTRKHFTTLNCVLWRDIIAALANNTRSCNK